MLINFTYPLQTSNAVSCDQFAMRGKWIKTGMEDLKI